MTVFAWIGVVCSVAILAIALMLTFGWAMDMASKVWDRWKWNHEQLMRRNIGNEIVSCAYWFGENPEVMEALKCFGENLSQRGNYDTNNVRAEWRRKMGRDK